MKLPLLAAAFSFALAVASCGGRGVTGNVVTLDTEAAIDNPRTFDLAEIADKIEFIHLDDSSKESLIGYIDNIGESENNFYILNSPLEPVKVFDKTGKFLSTRGTIGRGPDEHLFIRKFAVDYGRDVIWLGEDKIVAYDANGRVFARADSIPGGPISHNGERLLLLRWESAFSLPEAGDTIAVADIYSSDLHYESSLRGACDGNYYVRVQSSSGTPSGSYRSHFISNNGDRLLLKRGRNDTVYLFRNNAVLEPVYKLEMGRYSPPDVLFEGLTTREEWGRYYSIEKMWEGDRYIIAEVANAPFYISILVLDRRNPSGGFMPLGPDGEPAFFVGGIRSAPKSIKDNRLVGYMMAVDLVNGLDAGVITNPDLAALAATLKEDSNPVIVVATLKK
jgi:hypothetical protein